MLRVQGATETTDDYVEVTFERPGSWPGDFGQTTMAGVLIGDEVRGPSLTFAWQGPEAMSYGAPSHAHASDNFRISLLGSFEMGRESYGPGEFRIQQGWKPYPSDNASHGPEGGWEILLMADRRGTRARFVGASLPNLDEIHAQISRTFGLAGDLLSDDPAAGSGPSALATTLGPPANSGKLNGSFADRDTWAPLGPATRAAVALMGDPVCGPVLLLAATEPAGVAMPACRFDTEVFRGVVSGSCEIDGRRYGKGQMRVQRAGSPCGPVIAGPDGVCEVVIVADRRAAAPVTSDASWAAALGATLRDLQHRLAA